jgi:hypothetical protein
MAEIVLAILMLREVCSLFETSHRHIRAAQSGGARVSAIDGPDSSSSNP